MTRSMAAGAIVVFGMLSFGGGSALADHGGGHNGEAIEVSKSEDLVDGEVVTVTLTSFLPGNTVNLVTCYVFPALAPTDCNLANYGQHSADVADDGTATIDYKVDVIEGSCDRDNPCFIVAADGFGRDANYAAQQIYFAATEAVVEDSSEADEPDSSGETESEGDGPEAVDDEVVDETAGDTATENTAADSATADEADSDEVEDDADQVVEDSADATGEESGSSNWVIPSAIVVAALGFVGAFLGRRRRT